MIKRFKKRKEPIRLYRSNERIFAPTLRVLDGVGKQIGVLARFDALQKARELGLDLVEIAPNASPPVAKIIDFKKFLYQEAKKKQDEKRKTKVSETKEIRLGPFMNSHDLGVMVKRGRNFLEDGNKVRLVLKFMGRQIVHPEFGQEIVKNAISALSDIAKLERETHFEGKQLITILSPERKRKAEKSNEEKNQEIGSKKI